MNETKPLRVLIADDHGVVRSGLANLIELQADMDVAGEARDGCEAVELARRLAPDVVLMDVQMPTMDGIEATSRIVSMDPAARVVMLTTYEGDEDIYRALHAGAMAYVLKDAEADELFRTIRAVAAGKTCLAPDVAAKLAARVRGFDLTTREMEVLRLMASGKTNRAIADELFIAESTVKTHVNNILTKLNAADRTEAAAIALRRGLIHLGFVLHLIGL